MRTASQLVWRGIVLFLIGNFFTFVFNVLQARRYALAQHTESIAHDVFCSRWWLPLLCGSGSTFVGLIYPYLNHKTADPHISQEWSNVLRCVAMFVGINEAYAKIDFPSNLQLSLSLAILSVGLWWYFDRTSVGFGMGIIVAALAILVTQMLLYHEVCIYTDKELLNVRSWLLCAGFSGGITVGNIGKQLAVNDFSSGGSKSHAE